MHQNISGCKQRVLFIMWLIVRNKITKMKQWNFSRVDFAFFVFSCCPLSQIFFAPSRTKCKAQNEKSLRGTESRGRRPAGEAKIRLRSGERVLRSGRNDPVNRGDRPPDRCSANKKASALTHASQESQGRVWLRASPRGSCRATIDIVHRDISSYRPLSFSVPDSNDGARGAVVNSRTPAARGPHRQRNAGQSTGNASLEARASCSRSSFSGTCNPFLRSLFNPTRCVKIFPAEHLRQIECH